MKLVRRSKPNFNSILNDLLNDDFFKPAVHSAHTFRPPVNIKETDEAYQMELSVPGLSKKDVIIDIDGDLLTISYENTKDAKTEHVKEEKTEDEAPKVKYTRREFSAKNFKRTFTIPENIETEKIAASMKNGILSLSLPKVEVPEPEKKTVIIK